MEYTPQQITRRESGRWRNSITRQYNRVVSLDNPTKQLKALAELCGQFVTI